MSTARPPPAGLAWLRPAAEGGPLLLPAQFGMSGGSPGASVVHRVTIAWPPRCRCPSHDTRSAITGSQSWLLLNPAPYWTAAAVLVLSSPESAVPPKEIELSEQIDYRAGHCQYYMMQSPPTLASDTTAQWSRLSRPMVVTLRPESLTVTVPCLPIKPTLHDALHTGTQQLELMSSIWKRRSLPATQECHGSTAAASCCCQ